MVSYNGCLVLIQARWVFAGREDHPDGLSLISQKSKPEVTYTNELPVKCSPSQIEISF